MPSMAEKHCGREKQTKSDQKEVISGNMSHTRKNIKENRCVIYNKKASMNWHMLCKEGSKRAMVLLCYFFSLFLKFVYEKIIVKWEIN